MARLGLDCGWTDLFVKVFELDAKSWNVQSYFDS